jgi:hypothetical protein
VAGTGVPARPGTILLGREMLGEIGFAFMVRRLEVLHLLVVRI